MSHRSLLRRSLAVALCTSVVAASAAIAGEGGGTGTGTSSQPVAEVDRFTLSRLVTGADSSRTYDYADPDISDDGSTVVFTVESPPQFPPPDAPEDWTPPPAPPADVLPAGVYRYQPGAGDPQRLPVPADFAHAYDFDASTVSADGRFVAFTVWGYAGATGTPTEGHGSYGTYTHAVMLFDATTGTSRMVNPLGQSNQVGPPSISDDGAVVTYRGETHDYQTQVHSWTPYVADASGSRVAGPPGDSTIPSDPVVSGDGTRLVYWAWSAGAVGDAGAGWHLYADDLTSEGVAVSQGLVTPVGTYTGLDNDGLTAPSLSTDGDLVAYPVNKDFDNHVGLRNLVTGTTSVPQTFVDGSSSYPAISNTYGDIATYGYIRDVTLSGDGAWLSFSALHGEGLEQTWRIDRTPGAERTQLASHTPSGFPGSGHTVGAVSRIGAMAMSSTAPDLVEGDTNGVRDLLIVGGTPQGPDVWATDATLTAGTPADGSVQITWPAPTAVPAGQSLTGYRVYRDGAQVATPDAGTRSATVPGLTPGERRLSVRAVLDGTTLSGDALAAIVAIAGDPGGGTGGGPDVPTDPTDTTAPVWPADAQIAVADVDPRGATISWPAATDAVGVASYVVSVDGAERRVLSGSERSWRFFDLQPDTRYAVTVAPRDGNGNVGATLAVDVTTAFDPATLVDVYANPRPGGVVELSWGGWGPIGGTGDYVVLRAEGDGAFAEVGRSSGTTYADRGLSPATRYRYQIDRVAPDGAVRRYSRSVAVETPAVSISDFTFQTPTSHEPALGDDLTFTVRADGGGQAWVEATVLDWFDGQTVRPSPAAESRRIDLTEGPTGTYTGRWTFEEGIARVTALTAHATLAGSTAQRAASYVPGEVAGAVEVVVNGDWSEVDVAVVSARSDRRWDDARETVGTRDRVVLNGLSASDDYRIRLSAPAQWGEGERYAARDDVTVHPGRRTLVELDAQLPAQVAAGTTVDGVFTWPESVVVTDAASGAVLDSWTNRRSWWGMSSVPLWWGMKAGQTVTVTATFPAHLPVQRSVTKTLTLEPGTNEVALPAVVLDRADLSVGVLLPDGTPAHEAQVTVTQNIDGRPWTYRGTTGAEDSATPGVVVLDVLDGPALVRALRWGHNEQSVDVASTSAGVTAQVQLHDSRPYTLDVSLRTKLAGHDPVQQRMTGAAWTVPVEILVTNGYRTRQSLTQSPAVVEAEPGDSVEVCAVTANNVFARDCRTVVAPIEGSVLPAQAFDLEQYGAVTGTLSRADGSPMTGYWSATLEALDGSREAYRWGSGHSSRFALSADRSGPFRLTITSEGGRSAPRIVTIPEDAVLDLEQIVVGGDESWLLSSSAVTVPVEEVVSGSVVEVRSAWDTHRWYWDSSTDRKLSVPLPPGTSLVASSALLDGQPVEVVTTEHGFEIPLTETAHRGVLRYRVKVDELPTNGRLQLSATLGFTLEDVARRATLGVAELRPLAVSLVAPARTAKQQVPVSGRAPAGATVLVRADGRTVEQAVASQHGYWRTRVDLPYAGPQHDYVLTAVVQGADGTELVSEQSVVGFDLMTAELTDVVVRQEGRAAKRFDPREGLAQFQYVFAPYLPLIVELTFTEPERVKNLHISIGDEEPVPAVFDEARGIWSISTTTRGQGQIAADWDVTLPSSFPGRPVPTTEQVRGGLPPELADVPVEITVDEEAGTLTADIGGDDAASVQFEILESSIVDGPGKSGTEPGPLSVEQDETSTTVSSEVTITTTAADVAAAGSPSAAAFRALSADSSPLRRSAVQTFALGGYLDSVLPDVDEIERMRPDQKAVTRIKFIEKIGNSGFGLFNVFKSLYEHQQKLQELIDKAAWCPDDKLEEYERNVQFAHRMSLLADGGSALLGLAMGEMTSLRRKGPGGFTDTRSKEIFDAMPGVDTKLTGVGMGIDALVGAEFDKMYEALRNQIKFDPDCDDPSKPGWPDPEDDPEDKPKPPGGGGPGPLGAPTWLHDPSGNVYSGVASNPVQGVTATVLYAPAATGPWSVWNAEDFGQENPQTTDAVGHYGWDVVEGFWQVVYEKDGYEAARSEVLEVLPPHFDVHVGLLQTSAPTVTAVTPRPDGTVDVRFDRPMLADSVVGRVHVASGAPVVGLVTSVDGELAPDATYDRGLTTPPFAGRQLATTFRFTPSAAPAAGTALTVTVDDAVVSYADRIMGGDHVVDVTVPAVPAGDGGGGGGGGGTPVPPTPPTTWTPGSWKVTAGQTVPPGTHTATADRPVLVTVTAPVAGEVSIAEATGDVPDGWRVLGQQLQVEAPPATSPDDPLVLRFRVDRSALPDGEEGLDVLRDGLPVSEQCTGAGARPDPCLTTSWDGDDLVVEVRSTHASRWAVVLPVDAPVEPPVDVAPVCPEDALVPFRDVADDSVHRAGIGCLAALDITRGVTQRDYRPAQQVSRAQMASFLARMLERSGVELPAADSRFEDSAASVHAEAIGQLAALGIVEGVSRRRFEPDKVVTREQMASFLVRSYEAASGEQRPEPTDRFSDDDASVHEDAIDAAAALGVTTGVTADAYAPAKPVQRDQMASFLARLLAAVHAEG